MRRGSASASCLTVVSLAALGVKPFGVSGDVAKQLQGLTPEPEVAGK
jgi:hypothetical protein